jgi:hypothetical protein
MLFCLKIILHLQMYDILSADYLHFISQYLEISIYIMKSFHNLNYILRFLTIFY